MIGCVIFRSALFRVFLKMDVGLSVQTAVENIPEHIQKPLWDDNKLEQSSPWGDVSLEIIFSISAGVHVHIWDQRNQYRQRKADHRSALCIWIKVCVNCVYTTNTHRMGFVDFIWYHKHWYRSFLVINNEYKSDVSFMFHWTTAL